MTRRPEMIGSRRDDPAVTVTQREWSELEGCLMSLKAAIEAGGLEGGEASEAVVSSLVRFQAAMSSIRRRLDPDNDPPAGSRERMEAILNAASRLSEAAAELTESIGALNAPDGSR